MRVRRSRLSQAAIRQDDLVGRDFGLQALAAPLPLHAAHFEQVDEIRLERELQPHPRGLAAVVRQPYMLVAGRVPQQLGAKDVQRSLGQRRPAALSGRSGFIMSMANRLLESSTDEPR